MTDDEWEALPEDIECAFHEGCSVPCPVEAALLAKQRKHAKPVVVTSAHRKVGEPMVKYGHDVIEAVLLDIKTRPEGLSFADIAKAHGISKSYVSALARGQRARGLAVWRERKAG